MAFNNPEYIKTNHSYWQWKRIINLKKKYKESCSGTDKYMEEDAFDRVWWKGYPRKS